LFSLKLLNNLTFQQTIAAHLMMGGFFYSLSCENVIVSTCAYVYPQEESLL